MKRKKTCIGDLMFATSIKHLLLSCFTCALVAAATATSTQQQQRISYQHLTRHMTRKIPIESLTSAFYHRSQQQPSTEGNEFINAAAPAGLTRQYDTRQEAAESPVGAPSYRSSDQDESGSSMHGQANADSSSSIGLSSDDATTTGGGSANSAGRKGNDNNNSNPGNEPTDETNESSPEGSSSFENGDAHDHDESADNSQEIPERNVFIDHHNSQLQAMHDLFERRQLNNHNPLQSSQELSPMTIGLDAVTGAGSPFNMPPFSVPNHQDGLPPMPLSKPPMANADNIDQGLGPSLPFGLNHLPHLLGFQSHPFDGPQRGDQSAHTNHHAALPPPPAADQESGPSQKVWPKIFRFTDGRINLSEFEKQKKIRLSSKNQHNNDNHIESAPIMFDGRQLKRKSFLILHGGIFSK